MPDTDSSMDRYTKSTLGFCEDRARDQSSSPRITDGPTNSQLALTNWDVTGANVSYWLFFERFILPPYPKYLTSWAPVEISQNLTFYARRCARGRVYPWRSRPFGSPTDWTLMARCLGRRPFSALARARRIHRSTSKGRCTRVLRFSEMDQIGSAL
jgi:hypothetical protein